MSTKATVIHAICNLPIDFGRQNKSFSQLISESGYLEIQNSITDLDLVHTLRSQKGLIGAWMQWSEDKRVSYGPFFRKSGRDFEVGDLNEDHTFSNVVLFEDSHEACANFIMRELDID